MRAKINLSQQNQAVTFADRAVLAHPMPVTPTVKSGKTCISSFNGAHGLRHSAKSVDPTCYNVCVGGNSAAALFDIDGEMTWRFTFAEV